MEQFGTRVYALLNRPHWAKKQDEHGAYGYANQITVGAFHAHLRGECTIGLSAVDGGKANFLCVDIDDRFEQRLPIFAEVLRKRHLQDAAFGISGSSDGRGKLLVTLAKRIPQRQATQLVDDIVTEASCESAFGDLNDISRFPTQGDGSFPRLFGRNRRRVTHSGLCEAPLDLGGMLSDLYYVRPAVIEADDATAFIGRSRLSDWARSFIEQPFLGGTLELYRAQVRLAFEVVSVYGSEANSFLEQAFRRIESRSSKLAASSRRNLTRPDVVAQLIRYAVTTPKYSTIDSGYIWYLKDKNDVPTGALRVCAALAEYVWQAGLDPHCFGMSYGRIADLSGYASKRMAGVNVLAAERAGLLVRLDRGSDNKGDRMCTLYSLVLKDETPALARDRGMASAMYQLRIAQRALRGYDPQPLAA